MSTGAAAQLAAEYPSNSHFVPRQVSKVATSSMRSMSGSVTAQLAEAAVAHLPPLTFESAIHDNGCGDGVAIRAMLSRVSNNMNMPQIIWATDVASASAAVERLEKESKANQWPVSARLTSAEALDLPDNSISHSMTNSVFIRLKTDGATRASREIYRTLKPGGVAVISIFGHVPHRPALAAAHNATRPSTSPPLIGGAVDWEDGTLLRRVLQDGGFRKDQIRLEHASAINEVENLAVWEEQTWSVLGRPEAGWLESDEERWDEALKIFRETLRQQPEVDLVGGSPSARLTCRAWVAVVKKS